MSELKDKMGELREMQDKAANLRKQLDRSLTLRVLWRNIFDDGTCTAWWDGRNENRGYKVPEHRGHTFHIKSGKGEVREFPFEAVPQEFGGGL